jgi:hypothetical protein
VTRPTQCDSVKEPSVIHKVDIALTTSEHEQFATDRSERRRLARPRRSAFRGDPLPSWATQGSRVFERGMFVEHPNIIQFAVAALAAEDEEPAARGTGGTV